MDILARIGADPGAAEFWAALDRLAATCPVVIDRPRGSRHPRFDHLVYPLDYGYLKGTSAMDGGGIDLWRGSRADARIGGILCTVDLMKRDTEVKLLIGCTDDEVRTALEFHGNSGWMKALHLPRPDCAPPRQS